MINTAWNFTGGFSSDDGDQSNRAVMEKIKTIVDSENKREPFSDDMIASRLKDQGIPIARRTIAKYREKMGVLSSRQRKVY